MHDEIRTARLRLRRARTCDLDALHAVFTDRRAMRFWSTLPHADLEQTRVWLARMIAADPACSDDFVLEHAGRVVGKAGCWRLPEIGFILHPDLWGLGLAREALEAIIPHVFERLDVDALVADVDPRNEASLRLLGRLGFHVTGRAARTWHIGGEWSDSVYLSLPRPG